MAFQSRYKILACVVQACAESKISRQFLRLKVTQVSWLFLFTFSPLPSSSFAFLASLFFLCWAFSRLHFGGKNFFGNLFRILRLDKRKGRWVVKQDGNLRANIKWFFAFFSGLLDWIMLILLWFERYFYPTQNLFWLLKLMTSLAVEGMWIRTGGYRRFRDKWVN